MYSSLMRHHITQFSKATIIQFPPNVSSQKWCRIHYWARNAPDIGASGVREREKKSAYGLSWGGGTWQLVTSMRRWKDNIEMILMKIEWTWISLIFVKYGLVAGFLLQYGNEYSVSIKCGNLLRNWKKMLAFAEGPVCVQLLSHYL